jgi:hypothetical protein
MLGARPGVAPAAIQRTLKQATARYSAIVGQPRVRVARALWRFLLWPMSLVSGSVTLVALTRTGLTLAGLEGMFGWPETWALFSASRESFFRWLFSGALPAGFNPIAFYFVVSIAIAATLSFAILLRLYIVEARAEARAEARRRRLGARVSAAPLREGSLMLRFVEFFLGLNGGLLRRLLGPFLTGYLFAVCAGLWPLLLVGVLGLAAAWALRAGIGSLGRGVWLLSGWVGSVQERRALLRSVPHLAAAAEPDTAPARTLTPLTGR